MQEQNGRPQLLYTEQDRHTFDAAWKMSAAHLEDLMGRAAAAAPGVGIPRVVRMLQAAAE